MEMLEFGFIPLKNEKKEQDYSYTKVDTIPAIMEEKNTSFLEKCASLHETGQYKNKNFLLTVFIICFYEDNNGDVENRFDIVSYFMVIITLIGLMLFYISITSTIEDIFGDGIISFLFHLLFLFLFISILFLTFSKFIWDRCSLSIRKHKYDCRMNDTYNISRLNSNEFNKEIKKVLK